MSFDPFETRIRFLQILKTLNASQQSIHKGTAFAIKYGSRCGEDLWECIIEQTGKGTLNTRINVFYFLDSLLAESIALGPSETPYQELVTKNLQQLIDNVVPDTTSGILNLKSTKQILESWRLRRVIEPGVVEGVLEVMEGRKYETVPNNKRNHEHAFSRNEIVRRMEEDRERHKRLRERIWILPIPSLVPPRSSIPQTSPATPASPHPSSSVMPPPPIPPAGDGENGDGHPGGGGGAGVESALDVEFEQVWDRAGELDEDDLETMRDNVIRAGLLHHDLPSTAASEAVDL
ncbi:hypothetical protein B9479_006356 [Cryptococcus floricola]|uniref:CID domain-containing protein n=1 Tax=Cryptococcus floricola TaxID=2591691 RepID=A0A5D3ATF6_9TREE|nr:hypothetical protein B9479_006356 [Cryptococcus floricola]